MCGRFNLTASGEEIAEAFDLEDTPELAPRVQHRPHPAGGASFASTPRAADGAWPRCGGAWSPRAPPRPTGATSTPAAETAWQKPTFRDAFARRRCLIPATGFYEWQRTGAKKRRPWLFSLASESALRLRRSLGAAGPGGASPTCTILTTEPNDVTGTVHDRMPVILPPDAYGRWLDPKPGAAVALRPLLVPFPAAAMAARPVSTAVNNARFDDPACLDPEQQPPLPLG